MSGLAIVGRISAITPHPDPAVTRMEIIRVTHKTDPCEDCWVELVTGLHYRVGDHGVWIRPGAFMPGYLADQLWVAGKQKAGSSWFAVESKAMGLPERLRDDGQAHVRVDSPGLWCGEWYRTDTSKAAAVRQDEMLARGTIVDPQGFTRWPYWEKRWRVGDVVDDWLGVLEFNPAPHQGGVAPVGA